MRSTFVKTFTTLFLILKQTQSAPYTYLFDTKLDHTTSPGADDTPTFKIRYIVDDQYFLDESKESQTKPKPIFFYAGNEGDIWGFY